VDHGKATIEKFILVIPEDLTDCGMI